ncbi:SPFH domain-containing protein [Mycoplasma todarodis]|uniref:Peptidase n=1 Tax=Mycoplasma todarodis TaxID=1937191 RepID=A0A4R0XRQ0_9MOLU|nr:SPFH domain-containing protein [Mycoplasma todarodis]TCG11555.1 peptidase [Mycoplasma todarodis]
MGIAIGIVIGVLVLLVLIFVAMGVKIVPQTHVYVVERLGSFKRTLKNGVTWVFPILDRIVLKETLKERVLDFPAQDVITKDNVTMKIDTVVYMQITDPKLYAYGVENPVGAVENLTATTLRNLIGDLELDQTLTSRDTINEKLRAILDDATDSWGIKILRVELKNILPPEDIRRAMEKQMRAERGKREKILDAEGVKEADILNAEGKKRSAILRAEGVKEKMILEAEGRKRAIELINESSPTQASLLLKSYEALVDASNSDSSTIILPSDLTNVASMAATFKATNVAPKTTAKKTAAKKKSNAKISKLLEELDK